MRLSVGVLGQGEMTGHLEDIARVEALRALGPEIACGLELGLEWVRWNSGSSLPTIQIGQVAREGNVNGFTADCL